MINANLILLFSITLLSFLLTLAVRRYALKARMLDMPNARSSHTIPTPRGGGIAIVVAFVVGCVALYKQDVLSLKPLAALVLGGGAIAIIGLIDDRYTISPKWRLIVHFAAAVFALIIFGALPIIRVGTVDIIPAFFLGGPIAVFFIVWLLNLYNFMDGIDGIAGLEAVTTTGSMAWLLTLTNSPSYLGLTCLVLAAASVGFLLWNFPPAKIFMGDAGSGFLGYSISILAIWSSLHEPTLLWSWLIVLAVFITDATVTLMQRFARGKKISEAHRSHAYQRATQRTGSHLSITLSVCLINVLWLLPLAWLTATSRLDGALATVIAYTPLVLLALKLKAGRDGL